MTILAVLLLCHSIIITCQPIILEARRSGERKPSSKISSSKYLTSKRRYLDDHYWPSISRRSDNFGFNVDDLSNPFLYPPSPHESFQHQPHELFPPPCYPLEPAFRSEDDYHDESHEKKCKPETIIKYKIQKVKMPPKIVYKIKKVYVPKPVRVIKEVPVIKHVPIIKEKEKVIPIVKKKIIIKKIKVPVPYKVKYIKIKKVPVMKKIKVPVIRKVVKFIPKGGTVKHIHVHKVSIAKDKKKKKMGMMKKMKMKMKMKKMSKMMASMPPMCPPIPMVPGLPMVPGVPGVGRRKRELSPTKDEGKEMEEYKEAKKRNKRGILTGLALAAVLSNPMASRMFTTMNQGNKMKFADECADEDTNGVNLSSLFNGMTDDSNGMSDSEEKRRRRKKRSFDRSLMLGPRIVFFDQIGWKFYGPSEKVRFESRQEEEATISLSETSYSPYFPPSVSSLPSASFPVSSSNSSLTAPIPSAPD